MEAEIDHDRTGICWCGKRHAMMVEIHSPAPDWAPNTSDDVYEDDLKEGLDKSEGVR